MFRFPTVNEYRALFSDAPVEEGQTMKYPETEENRFEGRRVQDTKGCPRIFYRMRGLSRWRWPLIILSLTLVFSMGHLAGAVQKEQEFLRAKTIVAEGYELQGPDGKLYATLAKGSAGEARLSFFDASGRSRLEVGVDSNGHPSLGLYDESHTLRAVIGVAASGSPILSLQDEKGVSAISTGMLTGQGPWLTVGKKGQGDVSIGVSKDGSSSITISDPKSKPRIKLLVTEAGPSIVLYDGHGHIRSSWSVSQDGSPSMTLTDSLSKPRLDVSTDKDGKPSIRFFDQDGKGLKTLTFDSK